MEEKAVFCIFVSNTFIHAIFTIYSPIFYLNNKNKCFYLCLPSFLGQNKAKESFRSSSQAATCPPATIIVEASYQRWSPRGHILKSLALASKPQVLKNCPVLGSRTALFFELFKVCEALEKFFGKLFFLEIV